MEERALYEASKKNDWKQVEVLLQKKIPVDVNWNNARENNWTSLHIASRKGHVSVITVLLKHPKINVNILDNSDSTAFLNACACGKTDVVKLLLEDKRVNVNLPNRAKHPPIWFAVAFGYLMIVKWVLASNYEIKFDKSLKDVTKARGYNEIASLLEQYTTKPKTIKARIKKELEQPEIYIGQVFAMIVLVSDEYYTFNQNPDDLEEDKEEYQRRMSVIRFFKLAIKLPMELQMIISHRLFGSCHSVVLTRFSEPTFEEMLAH